MIVDLVAIDLVRIDLVTPSHCNGPIHTVNFTSCRPMFCTGPIWLVDL